jgi:anti-sigma B factor antagonist
MSYQQAIFSPASADSAPFGCVLAAEGPGVTRMTLTGELDLATVRVLDATLSKAAEDAMLVIVDLSALTFMDSAGLKTIATVEAQLRAANRRLEIIPGQPQVQRIFELSGLADRLPFTRGDPPSLNGDGPPHSGQSHSGVVKTPLPTQEPNSARFVVV